MQTLDPVETRPLSPADINRRPYVLLVATMFIWAANVVAGRLAVGQISPMLLVCARWGLVLALLAAFNGRRILNGLPVLKRQWRFLLAMGAAGFTSFNALFYFAAHHTTGVNIAIIQGSVPIMVMAGTVALHRMPLRAGQAMGMAMTLGGVALVATKGDLTTLASLRFNQGDLLMLAAGMLYAGYTLALRGRSGASGLVFFAGLAAGAFVTSIPLLAAELVAGQTHWPTVRGWWVLAFTALFPSFLAQVTFLRAVELVGPGRAGPFINLVPVFGALMGVVILRETMGPYHVGALGLVLAGIFLAERSARSRSPDTP